METPDNFDLKNKSCIESLVGFPIDTWETKGACDAGDNMAGSVTAIKVKPTSSNTEMHYIYKQIPTNPPDWIIQGQIFRREHAIYRTVVPKMKMFSKSRGHTYNSPLPIYYKGFNNDKSDYLLLEDLRLQGYQMVNKRRSLTFPEMSIILEELAKFHATGYALLRYEGVQILEADSDFQFISKDIFTQNEEGLSLYDDVIQLYYNVAAELMQSDIPELAARIVRIAPNACTIRTNVTKNPAYFQTIIHSDLWTNNLLLKYNTVTGVPEAVKFIDFQLAQIGNVFSDLTYLIYTSTTPEYRVEYLAPGLGIYYDAFRTTLDSLQCPLPIGFTHGFLLDEFRACRLAALVHMTFAVPLQLGDMVGVESEWEEAKKEEGNVGAEEVSALGDANSIKAMITRSPVAHQRFKDLFQEAATLNIL